MGLLVVVVACAPSDTPGTGEPRATDGQSVRECPSALSLEVGAGEDAYAPLAELEVVTMVHGPQGGWHVDTAGLVSGTTGQVSVHPRVVLRDSGEQVAGDQQPQYLALVDYRVAECDGEFFGVRAYLDDQMDELDPETPPITAICALAGRVATLTVDIGDLTTDELVAASVDVTLQLDPRDIDPCAGL